MITRRSLFGLWLLVRMGTVGLGLLTVESHRDAERALQAINPLWRLGVFVNGRERTNELVASDDRRGWVCGLLRKAGPRGKLQPYLDDNGNIAKFVLSCAVEYRLVTAEV